MSRPTWWLVITSPLAETIEPDPPVEHTCTHNFGEATIYDAELKVARYDGSAWSEVYKVPWFTGQLRGVAAAAGKVYAVGYGGAALVMTGGTVTLDQFIESSLRISGEVELAIAHHLLVAPGTRKGDVTRICAHQQALAQCRTWLDRHWPNAERHAVSSNGEAARMAAARPEGPLPTMATLRPVEVGTGSALRPRSVAKRLRARIATGSS